MLKKQFNLTKHPFEEHSDSRCYFEDIRSISGIDKLNQLVDTGPIGILIGRTGAGKTMLLKKWMEDISQQRDYKCIYQHMTSSKPTGLLRLIVQEIGERPKLGKDRLMKQIVDYVYHQRRTLILIIDEAHLLSEESLIDFRMLTCSINDRDTIRVLLSGQEPLRNKLQRECLRDIKERVCVSYLLSSMDEIQTNQYIDHRWTDAGGEPDFFDAPCRKLIFYHSQGVPRKVNHYATKCLLVAIEQGRKDVDEALARQAMKDYV